MKFKSAIAVGCFVPTLIVAATDRELDSHDHGAGAMNVAIDGGQVIIELEAPWENLVGFEHAPSTDEQKKLVDDALKTLEDPGQLFSFKGSDCSIESVDIENSMAHGDEGHGDEGHGDEAHGDEAHGDEAHGDDEHKASHSEVLALYVFNCTNADDLSELQSNIFNQWPGFDEIDVQLVGPNGATAVELEADSSSIDLSAVN